MFQRWTHAQAGCALQYAQMFGVHLYHKDTGQRREIVLQLDIRGGEPDFLPIPSPCTTRPLML